VGADRVTVLGATYTVDGAGTTTFSGGATYTVDGVGGNTV
jgi:hypothetical protein